MWTGLIQCFTGGFGAADVGFFVKECAKGSPERAEHRLPLLLTPGNGVQFVFHAGGEAVIHIALEMIGQKTTDHPSEIGGAEAALLDGDIFAVLQGLNNAGIGGWTADAIGFQGFNQGGIAITGGRVGKVLLGINAKHLRFIAGIKGRQNTVAFVLVTVIFAFLIDGHEAGKGDGGAVGTQGPMGAGVHIDGDQVHTRRRHLAGDAALPDQIIKAPEIAFEHALQGLRAAGDVRGADGFVRFLGVFGLGLVAARGLGDEFAAVVAADKVTDGSDGLFGEVDGVGTHVADEAHSLVADIDAFVELLGDAHGPAGVEAELARGFLLQGGRGEGCGRLALPALALHFPDP